MPRIRSVHPGLFTDEVFMELEAQAQIFMIGLWTEADDQGVFPWKPKTLKARLLPASTADAAVLLDELRVPGVIMRFEVDGVPYGAIRNFRKFQRPEKPKAIHPITPAVAAFVALPCNSHTCSQKAQAPLGGEVTTIQQPITDAAVAAPQPVPDPAPTAPQPVADDSVVIRLPVGDQSPTHRRQVADASPTDPRLSGRREEEGGKREGEKKEPTSLRSVGTRGGRLPEDWEPDEAEQAFARDMGLDPIAMAPRFQDYWRARAGREAIRVDWAATWRNWCRMELERRTPPAPRGSSRAAAPSRRSWALRRHADTRPIIEGEAQ